MSEVVPWAALKLVDELCKCEDGFCDACRIAREIRAWLWDKHKMIVGTGFGEQQGSGRVKIDTDSYEDALRKTPEIKTETWDDEEEK